MTGSGAFARASVFLTVVLVAVSVAIPDGMLLGNPTHPLARPVTPKVSAPIIVRLRPVSLPLPAPRTHTVAAGESLWKIAQDVGVTVSALAAANNMSEGALMHPGQVLAIPPTGAVRVAAPAPSAPAAPPRAPARFSTHTVAAGDTLWVIAQSTGLNVVTLAAANHLTENATLSIGQVLVIPRAGSVVPPPSPALVRAVAAPPRIQSVAERLRLLWPAAGQVTSRFGWRIHPIFRTREFHTGLDIATRWGSPVVAARSGIVRFVGWKYGYGQMIVLDHGAGLETTYSHLSVALVRSGERVAQGQAIGHIGSTGWSTGPHLFFEVRRDGAAVDPTAYLH